MILAQNVSIFAGGCRSEPIEIATLIENDKVYPFIKMNEYGTAWILYKEKQIPAEFAVLLLNLTSRAPFQPSAPTLFCFSIFRDDRSSFDFKSLILSC